MTAMRLVEVAVTVRVPGGAAALTRRADRRVTSSDAYLSRIQTISGVCAAAPDGRRLLGGG
jgi:hypothetical protein